VSLGFIFLIKNLGVMMRISVEEIQSWEKEYPTMQGVTLKKREKELLDGDSIRSHEGMMYGSMYADWKKRKGYEV
tara:strand:+ start:1571 stop:1795 length:225 start_codon:yes stop_codon:yes gene_type:complete